MRAASLPASSSSPDGPEARRGSGRASPLTVSSSAENPQSHSGTPRMASPLDLTILGR